MDEDHFTIAIIGLGLMGGSFAYALRGFRDCRIIGYDRDPATLRAAEAQGAIRQAAASMEDAVSGADLVIFCTYPGTIVQDIRRCAGYYKKTAVVTDICGVKQPLLADLPQEYIGIHPMAGKELDGFTHAEAGIFKNAGFILVPQDQCRQESIDLLTEMARYVGAGRVILNAAPEHDRIIAYTSDLMHITAAALCYAYPAGMTMAHTAGAFRDCTRVANLNPALWTELLLLNKDNIVPVLEQLIQNLDGFKQALKNEDQVYLRHFLATACANKKTMQQL